MKNWTVSFSRFPELESVTLLITFSINLQNLFISGNVLPQQSAWVDPRTPGIKAKIADGVMKKGRRKSHLLVTLARIEPKRSPYIRFKTLSAIAAGKEKKRKAHSRYRRLPICRVPQSFPTTQQTLTERRADNLSARTKARNKLAILLTVNNIVYVSL